MALIGCGAIAELFYLPALARYPAVMQKLVLVDPNTSRLKQLASTFRLATYDSDYTALQGIDGAIIAAPTHLHHPIALFLISRDIPVLCEKPLAPTIELAREIVDRAQQRQLPLAVNYNRRLAAANKKIKDMLSQKTLGAPLALRYSIGELSQWPTVSGFYFNQEVSPRGVLLDRGAHILDLVCWWLGGQPEVISSQNDSFGGPEAVARVEFKYGRCLGEVQLSLLAPAACSYAVECEEGRLQGGIYEDTSLTVSRSSGRPKRIKLKSKERTPEDYAFTVVDNFLAGLERGVPPLVQGRDVLDSVAFIDACYNKAEPFAMPWYESPWFPPANAV